MLGLDISKNYNYSNIVKIITHGDNNENNKNHNWTMSLETHKIKNKKFHEVCLQHLNLGDNKMGVRNRTKKQVFVLLIAKHHDTPKKTVFCVHLIWLSTCPLRQKLFYGIFSYFSPTAFVQPFTHYNASFFLILPF